MLSRSAKAGDGAGARADGIAGRSASRRATGGAPGDGIDAARAVLKTNRSGGNLLDFAFLDQAGNEIGTGVCARPPELQKDYYDGETIDSVAYVHTDNTARDADGVEEKVTPSYVDDKTILQLQRYPNGTGLTDPDDGGRAVVWQEVGFRGWGVAAEG